MIIEDEKTAENYFKGEADYLKKIHNPNVVGFIDFYDDGVIFFLILEYCNEGTLKTKQEKIPGGLFNEEDALNIFKQLINAMSSLHELNIIHRDLKPENILFSNGMLKLGNYSPPLDTYADATLQVDFGLRL